MKQFFYASNLSSEGRRHFGSLFDNEEQRKRMAHGVTYNSVTRSNFVHDVT